MGVVFEAVQESLGRHVALKMLPVEAVADPKRLERFRREAKAAAKLHHTNIVPVFGVGEADGRHYYAMQFIAGHPLDAVIDEVKRLKARSAVVPAASRWRALRSTDAVFGPRSPLTRSQLARPTANGRMAPTNAGAFPAVNGPVKGFGFDAKARLGSLLARRERREGRDGMRPAPRSLPVHPVRPVQPDRHKQSNPQNPHARYCRGSTRG